MINLDKFHEALSISDEQAVELLKTERIETTSDLEEIMYSVFKRGNPYLSNEDAQTIFRPYLLNNIPLVTEFFDAYGVDRQLASIVADKPIGLDNFRQYLENNYRPDSKAIRSPYWAELDVEDILRYIRNFDYTQREKLIPRVAKYLDLDTLKDFARSRDLRYTKEISLPDKLVEQLRDVPAFNEDYVFEKGNISDFIDFVESNSDRAFGLLKYGLPKKIESFNKKDIARILVALYHQLDTEDKAQMLSITDYTDYWDDTVIEDAISKVLAIEPYFTKMLLKYKDGKYTVEVVDKIFELGIINKETDLSDPKLLNAVVDKYIELGEMPEFLGRYGYEIHASKFKEIYTILLELDHPEKHPLFKRVIQNPTCMANAVVNGLISIKSVDLSRLPMIPPVIPIIEEYLETYNPVISTLMENTSLPPRIKERVLDIASNSELNMRTAIKNFSFSELLPYLDKIVKFGLSKIFISKFRQHKAKELLDLFPKLGVDPSEERFVKVTSPEFVNEVFDDFDNYKYYLKKDRGQFISNNRDFLSKNIDLKHKLFYYFLIQGYFPFEFIYLDLMDDYMYERILEVRGSDPDEKDTIQYILESTMPKKWREKYEDALSKTREKSVPSWFKKDVRQVSRYSSEFIKKLIRFMQIKGLDKTSPRDFLDKEGKYYHQFGTFPEAKSILNKPRTISELEGMVSESPIEDIEIEYQSYDTTQKVFKGKESVTVVLNFSKKYLNQIFDVKGAEFEKFYRGVAKDILIHKNIMMPSPGKSFGWCRLEQVDEEKWLISEIQTDWSSVSYYLEKGINEKKYTPQEVEWLEHIRDNMVNDFDDLIMTVVLDICRRLGIHHVYMPTTKNQTGNIKNKAKLNMLYDKTPRKFKFHKVEVSLGGKPEDTYWYRTARKV